MYFLYNIAIQIAGFFLSIIAFFHPKLRLFVEGRKSTISYLQKSLAKDDKVIWIHTASLGEFEQGLPLIQRLKKDYPAHKLLITFFSPSGYTVKKNTEDADLVCYLPMDTRKKVSEFIALVNPKIALFVKYEIWPNYFRLLSKKQVPLMLISAKFRKEQIYFKWYGGFMRRSLKMVSHFFVQDKASKELMASLGFTNCTQSGDTRFDRVSEIKERNNQLSFIADFKGDSTCFVGGSTWPEDESVFVDYINHSTGKVKYILAPHDIKPDHIEKLKGSFSRKTVLYSEKEGVQLADFDVLIVDSIGLLTKIYSYADIAYVGGGFATGLHNTLEPAVFGIPVLIGPKFKGFKEAEDLVQFKGVLVVENKKEFSTLLDQLLTDDEFRTGTGRINAQYIAENTGASIQIMSHIRTLL